MVGEMFRNGLAPLGADSVIPAGKGVLHWNWGWGRRYSRTRFFGNYPSGTDLGLGKGLPVLPAFPEHRGCA